MISLFKRPDTLSSSNQYSNNIWHFKFWRRRFLFIPTSQFTVVEVFVLNSEILVVYLVFPFLLYFTSTSWHLSDSSNYFRHLLNILYYKMTPKICWGLLSCVRCLWVVQSSIKETFQLLTPQIISVWLIIQYITRKAKIKESKSFFLSPSEL